MSINRLDHLGIRIRNIHVTAKFYEKFGFALTRKDYNEGVFVLKHSNGLEINLIENCNVSDRKSNILMDYSSKYPGYTHFALEVTSIENIMHYLATENIAITEGPVVFGDMKKSIFIRDPDMNVIELTQPPGG